MLSHISNTFRPDRLAIREAFLVGLDHLHSEMKPADWKFFMILCNHFIEKGYLSPKQESILFEIIAKYS